MAGTQKFTTAESVATSERDLEPLAPPNDDPHKHGRGGTNGTPPMHARRLTKLQLSEAIINARRSGMSYSAIARALTAQGTPISNKTAHQYVQAYLRELIRRNMQSIGEYRQLELERCDRMQAGIWEKATKGDVDAIFACMKIMDHRAKLLGLVGPAAQRIDDDDRTEFRADFGPVIDVTPGVEGNA